MWPRWLHHPRQFLTESRPIAAGLKQLLSPWHLRVLWPAGADHTEQAAA
jgi:hypothetical protein